MSSKQTESGFTIPELLVVMVLSVIIAVTFYTFFKTNLFTYLNLQKDASSLTDLASESQRVASVVRGLTSISSADANDLVIYAYFFPTDAYVSQVHYYITNNQLQADVTPMTANPPTGTLLTAQKKTYVIIGNFSEPSGVALFNYLDASNTVMTTPVSEMYAIKGITINLATPNSVGTSRQTMNLTVSLRNKKNNL